MEFFHFNMKQKFLTSFERETLQNPSKSFECPQCFEPVTNPICHDCLGNQILAWLGLYPSIKKKIASKLMRYKQEVGNFTLRGINCASCGKKKAALCPYCFTEEIFNMLKRSKIDKMVIMDFLCIFNFDAGHQGYIAEAVKEGLY